MTSLRAVVSWTSPVLCATLAARAFAGDADAPLLVLLAVAGPLIALLVTRRQSAGPAQAFLAAPGHAAVVWANLLTILELARVHGIHRDAALAAAALLVLLPVVLSAGGDDWTGLLAALAIGGIVAPLAVVGAADRVTPWSAWSDVASRPLLVFGDRSGWTTAGRTFVRQSSLTFTELHRITAVTPATYRVIESDGGRETIRDRRLASGEALVLRSGDRLEIPAGARLRFEPGKRVPGIAPSGVAWAASRRQSDGTGTLARVGAAVTLIGGALALVPPAPRAGLVSALTAPAGLVAFALASACWGVYAMHVAPDLSIAAGPLTALLQLPPLVVHRGQAAALVGVVGLALLALFTATAGGLWQRVRATACVEAHDGEARLFPAPALGLWLAICVLAFGAALLPSDPWAAWCAAAGFLAAVTTAPALAGGDGRAMVGGAVTGAALFVGLTAAGTLRVISLPAVTAYPALVAAPLAWSVTMAMRLCAPSTRR